ncbi:MAG: hypothetical protein QXO75_05775 [Nitrososphaerota archaeon]
MSISLSYVSLTSDIIIISLSVALSTFAAWILDRRKEKARQKEEKIELYRNIIDKLSDVDIKNNISAREFNSFINENKHRFDSDFKNSLPEYFDVFWVISSPNSGDIQLQFKGHGIFQNLKGEKISAEGEISNQYYYFKEEETRHQWEVIANKALEKYVKLAKVKSEDKKWMLKTIPEKRTNLPPLPNA